MLFVYIIMVVTFNQRKTQQSATDHHVIDRINRTMNSVGKNCEYTFAYDIFI